VTLQSTFTPSNATSNFSLKVKVAGPTKEPDPRLLIVQCAYRDQLSLYHSIPRARPVRSLWEQCR
jgi:hypothetical protein